MRERAIYMSGVVYDDMGACPVYHKFEFSKLSEDIRKIARKLYERKIDEGVVLIVDGDDYVEQFGEFDGDIDDLISEVEENI